MNNDWVTAYNYVDSMIENASTYFDFGVCDYALNHFKTCYPRQIKERGMLIDKKCDRFQECFNPLLKLKNQNK